MVLLPNQVFNTVVSGLDPHVGDILAIGVTKKALQKYGYDPDTVTVGQMRQALRAHIGPALTGFMSPDKSRAVVKDLAYKIAGGR